MSSGASKVFISYSHDSDQHKDWVLTLATRLVNNGVDVILDQWNLTLGGDLPQFMESGLTEAKRVLAICTDNYVKKANRGAGGVGYEKMILTGQLMQDIQSDRIIPVIRDNDNKVPIPTFLASKAYVDFRDDQKYEEKYEELVREIHGEKIKPRPPLGYNPFKVTPKDIEPKLSFSKERYISPTLAGIVTFDYSNNNGRYIIGAGDMAFETAWTGANKKSIHAYNDPKSIRSIALITDIKKIEEIEDASTYDTSSRVRTAQLGEIVVWQNSAGYYAATKIETLKCRSHGSPIDEVVFSYVIQPNKTASFRG